MSDNRRDQLIEFVEREFIGPDPIDWPGMTQSNGQEILASDPPRTRYIAGILYPAETTDDILGVGVSSLCRLGKPLHRSCGYVV